MRLGKPLTLLMVFALWAAVLKSPGFAPSFSRWWPERCYVCPNDPCSIPQFCPASGVAHQIFDAVFAEVRLFERRLVQMRAAHRTAQHAADRDLIFREVARPPAEPVETLLHQVSGVVEDVDDQESAVILTESVDVRPGFALWVGGSPKDVIHAEADKVWLADVEGIQATDRVVQSEPVGDLEAIFEAFHTQWKQRWCRHDNTSFRQWDQLVGFASRVLRPAPVPHLRVDVDLLRAEVSRKKKTAATGLDGVSRQDLLLADDQTLQSLVNAFCRAESDGMWPCQLLAGKVHSLAKCSGASGVGDYRPITVFGLLIELGPAFSRDTSCNGPKPGLKMEFMATGRGARPQTFGISCFSRLKWPTVLVNPFAGCRLTWRNASTAFLGFLRCALRSWQVPLLKLQLHGLVGLLP
jgi:hypothetical protein